MELKLFYKIVGIYNTKFYNNFYSIFRKDLTTGMQFTLRSSNPKISISRTVISNMGGRFGGAILPYGVAFDG